MSKKEVLPNGRGVHAHGNSVNYAYNDSESLVDAFAHGPKHDEHLYARFGHPAHDLLAAAWAKYQGAPAAIMFANGLAAIGAAIEAYTETGDMILVSSRVYDGTRNLFNYFRERCGVHVEVVDITDHDKVKSACQLLSPKLLFCETLSNPDMVRAEIPALADIAHHYRAMLIVDDTFTPFAKPMFHGADVVVTSLTKYASGYSRVLAGALTCSYALSRKLTHPKSGIVSLRGTIISFEAADGVLQSLPTLNHRFDEALKQTDILLKHIHGTRLESPWETKLLLLKCTVLYAVDSAVFSVVFPNVEIAHAFAKELYESGFGDLAVSLGSVHNLVFASGSTKPTPSVWKHSLPFEPVPPGLVRIAVGHGGNWRKQERAWMKAVKKFCL